MTEALRLPIEIQAEEDEEDRPASLLDRIGIPRPLFWGFVGCLLFMSGDGVESGFLSPYMQSQRISAQQVPLMFSFYGFVIAVASCLSVPLSVLWVLLFFFLMIRRPPKSPLFPSPTLFR